MFFKETYEKLARQGSQGRRVNLSPDKHALTFESVDKINLVHGRFSAFKMAAREDRWEIANHGTTTLANSESPTVLTQSADLV